MSTLAISASILLGGIQAQIYMPPEVVYYQPQRVIVHQPHYAPPPVYYYPESRVVYREVWRGPPRYEHRQIIWQQTPYGWQPRQE